MNNRDLDQRQLVNGIKALNPRIIDQFVDQYSGPLFSVILNYAGNSYDAEEILQDTFMRAIKRIERLASSNRPSTHVSIAPDWR